MAEEVETQDLLPSFSLKRLAIYFTLSILFAWVFRQAMNGQLWAIALVGTASATVMLMLIFAFVFLMVWIPARFTKLGREKLAEGSPFAKDQLPPQLIRPSDREAAS